VISNPPDVRADIRLPAPVSALELAC